MYASVPDVQQPRHQQYAYSMLRTPAAQRHTTTPAWNSSNDHYYSASPASARFVSSKSLTSRCFFGNDNSAMTPITSNNATNTSNRAQLVLATASRVNQLRIEEERERFAVALAERDSFIELVMDEKSAFPGARGRKNTRIDQFDPRLHVADLLDSSDSSNDDDDSSTNRRCGTNAKKEMQNSVPFRYQRQSDALERFWGQQERHQQKDEVQGEEPSSFPSIYPIPIQVARQHTFAREEQEQAQVEEEFEAAEQQQEEDTAELARRQQRMWMQEQFKVRSSGHNDYQEADCYENAVNYEAMFWPREKEGSPPPRPTTQLFSSPPLVPPYRHLQPPPQQRDAIEMEAIESSGMEPAPYGTEYIDPRVISQRREQQRRGALEKQLAAVRRPDGLLQTPRLPNELRELC